MNILLFGISNVGKTETAKALAARLGYSCYDLDIAHIDPPARV